MTQVNEAESTFSEYIKAVAGGTPVFQIEIPHDENAMHEVFFPSATSTVVTEDSDRFVISNEMISTQPDNCGDIDFHGPMLEALRERMVAGKYSPDLDFKMPESFTDRIRSLVQARQKTLNKNMIWFAFSVEDRECYSSWPVGAYRFGASNQTCFNMPKVAQALRRLMKRYVIQGIRVTGPIPKHWYFGPIDHSE